MIQITPEERAILKEARALIDKILDGQLETPRAADTTAAPEPKWMKLSDYARSRSIGRRTLDDYIGKGLPTKGAGKSRRVVVADADAWLERHRG